MPEEHKKRIKPVIEEVVEETNKPEEEKADEVVEKKSEAIASEPEPVKEVKESKKMNLKLVVVITLVSSLVAAFVSGGVYVYLSGIDSTREGPSETSTPVPIISPEATVAPESEPVDLSEYSVRVLNGSGAIGAAGAGEDILVEAGFTVDSTGNASNYNFKSTVVQVKSSVAAEAVSKAKEALETAKYKVEVGEALPGSSDYDMVVTIGQN